MKEFTYVVLLMLVGQLKAEVNTAWEIIASPGVELMKKSTEFDETYISILKKEDSYDLTSFLDDDYIKKLPTIRNVIHKMLDITQYKIIDYKISKNTEEIIIKIRGTYLKQNKSFSFCESHSFTAKQFVQKQLFYPTVNEVKILNNKNSCDQVLIRNI